MNLPTEVSAVAQAVKNAGGRALVVGGYVRDRLFGLTPKDIDIEVYGLQINDLERVLAAFGEVHAVGKAFGVLKVLGFDISVPRRDSKVGEGHRGFVATPDPNMSLADAAKRRDFTMNSMAMDPLTGELLDPYDGARAIKDGRLSMTDPKTFVEDPLRVLRAAQFIARFDLTPDVELIATCKEIAPTLRELPGERLFEEWNKLLLKGRQIGNGLRFLCGTDAIKVLFPEVEALIGCQQEPEWHPEGDVFIHTCMALEAAVEDRTGDVVHDSILMYGTLCHDFGKPSTTKFEDGRWRSKSHEDAGTAPATAFLERLRAPNDLVKQVCALVAHHLAPAHFSHPKMKATPKAYRNLARKLSEAGTTVEMLYKVAKADHFGRTTPDAIARLFPAGDDFLQKAREIKVEEKPEPDVVMGRHLIARGMQPGPQFGKILDACRDIQYETGNKDPEDILRQVIGESRSA